MLTQQVVTFRLFNRSFIIDSLPFKVALAYSCFHIICSLFQYKGYYISAIQNFAILDSPTKNFLFLSFHVLNIVCEFILFVLLIYLTLNSKLRYKIGVLIVLLFCYLVESGYQSFYGRFSDQNDIRVAITATSEQAVGLISNYFDIKLFYIVGGFIIACSMVKKNIKKSKNGIVFIAILLFFAHSLFLYLAFSFLKIRHKDLLPGNINTNVSIHLPTGINTVFNSGVGWLLTRDNFSQLKRERLPFVSSKIPQNNIVIVVDETLRGDHLNINGYQRATTTYLGELEKSGFLANFGICTSGSTSSLMSNNLLLMGETLANPNVIKKKIYRLPTLFQYAKAMNYETYFFDPQKNEKWAGIPDDYNFIDHWVFKHYLATKKDYDIDFSVAQKVNEVLSKSSGNLIYIFKRGFHFPYQNNFPLQATFWKPSQTGYKLDANNATQLTNAYDNSLKYNIDHFFETLLGSDLSILKNTTIIYTGDHGEMLGEDGKTTAHGGSDKLSATVPLIVIGKNLKLNTKLRTKHSNILPTVLDLIKYPKALLKYSYDQSLLKKDHKEVGVRSFILPDLIINKVIEFDREN